MRDEPLDDLLRFILTRRLNRETQNIFHTHIVQVLLEDKIAEPEMFLDRPAREATREFHHVLLTVTAIDSEGVEFHEFAGVILVRRALMVGLIVEIDQHRRRMRGRPHQVAEGAERVLANHFAVIHSFQVKAVALFDEDVEVVAPKLDHEFVELTPAVDLAHECGLAQFVRDGLAVIIVEESVADAFEFVGVHVDAFERLQLEFTGKITDGFERELFFYGCLQANLCEAGAFFDARTECESVQRQEVARIERSPRDGGEVTGESAVDGRTGGERRAGSGEGGEFEEVASGEHGNW